MPTYVAFLRAINLGAKRKFPKAAIKAVVAADPDIKILVLASAAGGKGPGPLVAAVAKEGAGFSGRKLPVTVVPGDLTAEELDDLA